MDAASAVELAYLVQEHGRTAKLSAALEAATDVTMQTEGLRFSISEAGVVTHPELPQMLVRSMFQQGLLQVAVQSYLADLNQRLKEFGITIEPDLRMPKHVSSKAS